MDEIISWLERNIEQCGRLEIEALSKGHNTTALQWNIKYSHFQEVLDYIHARRPPECEPDWQTECLEWRRGVGEFMEWLTPLVLHIPSDENIADTNFKRALDARLVYALVYRKCQELCPVAVINFDPPPLTPEELAEVNQVMKDEKLR